MTNITQPTPENIAKAKEILANGGVVAFPTETVYWLWANALNEKAVSSIFTIKWRPQDNPIIVHLWDKNKISDYAFIENNIQQKIIDKLMPWPITILLQKKDIIPDLVTAGSSLVWIRIPSNKVALDLLKTCDLPIAAPSANISTKPSPTSAQMVYDNFWDNIPMIIDWDTSNVWIESTVLKVENNEIIITRPWFVTKEDLEDLFENKVIVNYANKPSEETPWNKYKHYAPKAKVKIISSINEICSDCENACLIATSEFIIKNQDSITERPQLKAFVWWTKSNLATCAFNLFSLYHQCDKLDIDHIYIQQLPEIGIGFSIMNRVKKSVN